MKNYAAYLKAIKGKIHRKCENGHGVGPRFIFGSQDDLFRDVASVCDCYLMAKGLCGDEIASLLDNDILWGFERFIDEQIAAINSPSDSGALIDGLVAIAVIGNRSDPRDVLLWIRELYNASVKQQVPDLELYFDNISKIASTRLRSSSYGLDSVSSIMKRYPIQAKNCHPPH